jgi:hypothetical protein
VLSTTSPAAYAVYEPLRPVEPPDSPLAGTLARASDGRTVLLIDRETVAEWPGWGADGEAHLLAPVDVVRRPDGHDVVVPALTERVDAFLERRVDAGAPLAPGEAVTLAVSVIRGLAPSLSRAGDIDGQWWLADDGRPMLVEGVGDATTRTASAEICASVAEGLPRTRLGAALRDLADALQHPSFVHDSADWEERVFACGEPEPLVTEVLGPVRARRVAVETMASADEASARTLWQRVAFHADADLAEAASDAWTEVLRRVRARRPSRLRPLVWAGAIAAVIVVGGLLWPAGSDDPVPTAVTTPVAPAGSASEAPASTPSTPDTPAPDSSAPDPADAAAVTAQLLERRRTCGDTACLATVLEDPARALRPGVVDAPDDKRSVTLLDDLGGLVVVRVDSTEGLPVQLVTVVQTQDGWRIRDVHDVTDAPS